MDDLVRWLREQLDEDERIALAATDGPWTPWRGAALHGLGDLLHPVLTPGQKPGAKAVIATASWLDAEHIAAHDPARVLREIEAKRRIVDAYLPAGADPHPGLPCTDDIEGDPNGEFYAEQSRFEQGACVRHLEASRRLLHYDYVLRLLATVYRDRPGYRAEEWAP